jgi:hypothetical protein
LYESVHLLTFYDGNLFSAGAHAPRGEIDADTARFKKRTDGDTPSVQLLRFSERDGGAPAFAASGQSRGMTISDA